MQTFSTLATAGFLLDHRIWATHNNFDQSYITMGFKVTSLYTQQLNFVVTHLQTNTGTAFIFVNSKSLFKLLDALQDRMDMKGAKGDAIHIHVSLDRKEKLNNDIDGGVLPSLYLDGYIGGGPCYWSSWCAACHYDGMAREYCNICPVSWAYCPPYAASVVSTCGWTVCLSDSDLLYPVKIGQPRYNGQQRRHHRRSSFSFLSIKEVKEEIIQGRLWVDSNRKKKSCQKSSQQRRIQLHLARGHLANDAENNLAPCVDQCPVCIGEWDKLFLPVRKDVVIA